MSDTVEDILRQANILRSQAYYEDGMRKQGKYKWELGVEVYSKLQTTMIEHVNYYDGQEHSRGVEFMGIPVSKPNYDEPNIIKLWREVEV